MRQVDTGATGLTKGFSWLWLALDVKVRRATTQRLTNFEVNMTSLWHWQWHPIGTGKQPDPINPIPSTWPLGPSFDVASQDS